MEADRKQIIIILCRPLVPVCSIYVYLALLLICGPSFTEIVEKMPMHESLNNIKRKRKRSDSVLWPKPIHQQENPKNNVTTQKKPPRTSITRRLRTDLGGSVGVTTSTKLLWLNSISKNIRTSARAGYAPPVWMRAQVKGLKETNIQRGRGSGPCLFWGGLDKSRHIVPTAFLVGVQCFRKTVQGYRRAKYKTYRPLDDNWVIL